MKQSAEVSAYQAIASELDINALASKSDLLNIKAGPGGGVQITAESGLANGGTSSFSGGGVKTFNTAGNGGNGTIQYRSGTGEQFTSIPTGTTDQGGTTTIGAGGAVSVSGPTTVTGFVGSLSQSDWLLIGGAVAAALLLVILMRENS